MLPGARGVFLVGVRDHQRGVQIDHHQRVLGRRCSPGPDPFPGGRPRPADRRQRVLGILGQGRDQPRHRRIRGHRPEHCQAGRAAPRHQPLRPRPTRPRSRDPPRSCPGHASPAACATWPAAPTTPAPAHSAGRSPPATWPRHATPTTRRRRSPPARAADPSSFTCDVPRNPVDHGLSNHDSNRAEQALSRIHRPRVAAKVNLDESPRPMALPRRAQPDAGPLQGLSHRLGVAAMALGQALTGPAVVVELDGRVEPGGRDVLATESDAGLSELRCRRHPVQGDRGTVACASIRWWPERGRSWLVERTASPGWPLRRAMERGSDQRRVAATSQDLFDSTWAVTQDGRACRTGFRSRRARPVGVRGVEVRASVGGHGRRLGLVAIPSLSRSLPVPACGVAGLLIDARRWLIPGGEPDVCTC